MASLTGLNRSILKFGPAWHTLAMPNSDSSLIFPKNPPPRQRASSGGARRRLTTMLLAIASAVIGLYLGLREIEAYVPNSMDPSTKQWTGQGYFTSCGSPFIQEDMRDWHPLVASSCEQALGAWPWVSYGLLALSIGLIVRWLYLLPRFASGRG